MLRLNDIPNVTAALKGDITQKKRIGFLFWDIFNYQCFEDQGYTGWHSVIILTIIHLSNYAEAASVRFCFLIFSTRVVLLMFRSFAALVLTQLLFSKASIISFFS